MSNLSSSFAMDEKEQVQPLALAADTQRYSTTSIEAAEPNKNKTGHSQDKTMKHQLKNCLVKCCGCIIIFILIQAILISTLMLTVFKVKVPEVRVTLAKVVSLDLLYGTTPKPGTNMTFLADVAVKNPNAASFRFSNTSATLYYYGVVIGDTHGPPGKVKAGGTLNVTIWADVVSDPLMSSPNINGERERGLLNFYSYSRMPGRIEVFKIIKLHVVVKLKCDMTLNISNGFIQVKKCGIKVRL